MTQADQRKRNRELYFRCDSIGLSLDINRMMFSPSLFDDMAQSFLSSFKAMNAIESGARANADEDRMVGNYWLGAADRAPTPENDEQIDAGGHPLDSAFSTVQSRQD